MHIIGILPVDGFHVPNAHILFWYLSTAHVLIALPLQPEALEQCALGCVTGYQCYSDIAKTRFVNFIYSK